MTVKFNPGFTEKAKKFQAAVDTARQVVCNYWATNMLPCHFERGAHAKYQYASRSSKYLHRRGKAGKPDLVYSGRSRDRLTSPAFRRFSTSKGVTAFKPIVGSDIRYFWMTRPGDPNKPEEMKRLHPEEIQRLQKIFRMVVLSEMAKDD